jgi:hypothetical protein
MCVLLLESRHSAPSPERTRGNKAKKDRKGSFKDSTKMFQEKSLPSICPHELQASASLNSVRSGDQSSRCENHVGKNEEQGSQLFGLANVCTASPQNRGLLSEFMDDAIRPIALQLLASTRSCGKDNSRVGKLGLFVGWSFYGLEGHRLRL